MSVEVTANVQHCVNADGHFDSRNGLRMHSVRQEDQRCHLQKRVTLTVCVNEALLFYSILKFNLHVPVRSAVISSVGGMS